MTVKENRMTEVQIERLTRAIEELGFNGAVTRMPSQPALGIGESIVLELRKITEQLERIASHLETT
jgi:hypothetical protein